MRILIRTSKWAIAARRLGALAVPLVVLAVVLHHLRLIGGTVFLVAIVGAGLVAALAVLVALVALLRLWYSGDRGWGLAFAGLFLGAICLAPFGYYGGLMLRYPPVTDIATASRDLMPLTFDPAMATMPPPRMLSPAEMARVFPNIEARIYPLDVSITFALAQRIVSDNGWMITLLRAPQDGGRGQINAQIVTWPGWREEVVVLVSPDPEGARVDMRSASLNALHDFGANGKRIETFLAALDEAVTVFLRDSPDIEAADEADSEETPDVPMN
ncbi:MAG: hypothetical protein ABS76_02240 [Pelagibacterium sp. SCN 64-44]|nr:MAG: hypothetical protein ABS76_02240 [Pelagibacterium sp. SCN 64-44]